MERKNFKFTIDNMDEETGTFTGYASVFGVVDSYREIVDRGAFKKTLRENGKFPMLWSHDVYIPLGVVAGEEDDVGLRVKGQYNMDVQKAREIRSLAKQGAVNGLSIGFNTVKEFIDKEEGTRHLKEIKLWEVSPCVFQACPGATIEEVKAMELKPYPNEHAARLRDPDDFDQETFRRKNDGTIYGKIKVPDSVAVIWGKLKGSSDAEDNPIPQALRFPTKEWTAAEAKAWLKDNNVKYVSFEAAEKSIERVTELIRGIDPGDFKTVDDHRVMVTRAISALNALVGGGKPDVGKSTIHADDEPRGDAIVLLDDIIRGVINARN